MLQKLRLLQAIAIAIAIALPATAFAQDLSGHWEGEIKAPGSDLQVMVDLEQSDDGWVGTIDIPAQGAKGLKLQDIEVDGSSAKFRISGVPGEPTFDGTLSGDELTGKFKQGPASLDFRLGREAVERPKRPQEPTEPFPYDVEEVTYSNGDVTLAATITTPKGPGPFPGAVLITGSGAQDRDETLLGHKPFLVLADHLTRNGIAVLRADDRGIGGSTGDPMVATSEDYATDALASLEFLRGHKKVDPARAGLIGHSEGGMIAPMVASRSDAPAFAVLLAGTGVSGAEILSLQQRLILKANGAPDGMVNKLNDLQKQAIAAAVSDKPENEIRAAIADIVKQQINVTPANQRPQGEALDQAVDSGVNQLLSPWFRFFLKFDPRSTLRKTTIPVLALNGELDLQVDADQNLGAIEKALAEAGNDDVTVVRFPELNHLFQHSKTGSPSEYATIEETMSPEVLETISAWVLERFKAE